jgi:hypothetical protein
MRELPSLARGGRARAFPAEEPLGQDRHPAVGDLDELATNDTRSGEISLTDMEAMRLSHDVELSGR